MGIVQLLRNDLIQYGDGDDDEPEVLQCDCGNTLMQIDIAFSMAYCSLCGTTWEPDND